MLKLRLMTRRASNKELAADTQGENYEMEINILISD